MPDAFVEALKSSRHGLKKIEQWLNEQGYAVISLPSAIRPDVSQRDDYRDEGDMYVGVRAEGKHLSAEFTGREDWPFGRHFIVCAKEAFDRAAVKPRLFYYLSKSEKTIAIVRSSSKPYWYSEFRRDGRPHRSSLCEYYICPIDHVEFQRV